MPPPFPPPTSSNSHPLHPSSARAILQHFMLMHTTQLPQQNPLLLSSSLPHPSTLSAFPSLSYPLPPPGISPAAAFQISLRRAQYAAAATGAHLMWARTPSGACGIVLLHRDGRVQCGSGRFIPLEWCRLDDEGREFLDGGVDGGMYMEGYGDVIEEFYDIVEGDAGMPHAHMHGGQPMGIGVERGIGSHGYLESGSSQFQPSPSRSSGGRGMPGASALGPSIRGFTERAPAPSTQKKEKTKKIASTQQSPDSEYVYGAPSQGKPTQKLQLSENPKTKAVAFSGSTNGASTTTPNKTTQSKVHTLANLPQIIGRRCSSSRPAGQTQPRTPTPSSHPFQTQGRTLGTSTNPSDAGTNPRILSSNSQAPGASSRAQGTTERTGGTTSQGGSRGRTERGDYVTYSGMPTNIRKRPDYKGAGSRGR